MALTTATLNAETPIPQYWTPIGEGLKLAVTQFELDTEEGFYSNKVILLLSDGKQNRGDDPLTVDIPDGVEVYAVGLGEDDIEPQTIRDIAENSMTHYRITPSPREMEDFFIQILCDTSWKLQDITVTGSEATIDQDIAVFIVVWDDPSASISFDLDPPGAGPDITPTTGHLAYPPMDVTYHPPAAGETHAYYVCRNIPSNLFDAWSFANINDGGTAVPLGDVLLKVIEDPQTIAEFDIENVDHYTGQPIRLTVTVREDGAPKTGLTEVYAELLRSPAQSAGTLMAQNEPPSGYPSHPSAQDDLTLYSHYLIGVMEQLGLDSLSEAGGPRIYLRDDGLGGDGRADDGVYTGLFADTTYEGSYTFRFRATGENRDGVTFDRTKTLSEYVKFAADPTETIVEVASFEVDRQAETVTATIRVTPLDEFGSYLGPFRGDPIRLWTTSGEIEPSGVEHLDGSYSYVLTYTLGEVPLVSASVGSVVVTESVPVEAEEAEEPDGIDMDMLILLALLLIALIILIRIIRRS